MLASIILPIYNEQENLKPLVEEIVESLSSKYKGQFEIIAVDDGSTDGSFTTLKELRAVYPFLKIIRIRKNSGQAAAFDVGFQHASGEIVVTMDADRQNDPKDIPRFLEKIGEGYEFVSGWRRDRKDALVLRKIPSLIANWLVRRVSGIQIHDLGCSLKAYKRDLVIQVRVYGELHRLLAVLMHGLGAKTTELETNHRPRVAGVSKYGLTRSFKLLLDLFTVWFLQEFRSKPIYVFGVVGIALLVLSGGSFAIVAIQKLAFEIKVHRNPLLILSVFMGVLGVQSIFLGLLAELIMRTYFESTGRAHYTIAESVGFQATSESKSIKSA